MEDKSYTKAEYDSGCRRSFADGFAHCIKTVLQQQELVMQMYTTNLGKLSETLSEAKESYSPPPNCK